MKPSREMTNELLMWLVELFNDNILYCKFSPFEGGGVIKLAVSEKYGSRELQDELLAKIGGKFVYENLGANVGQRVWIFSEGAHPSNIYPCETWVRALIPLMEKYQIPPHGNKKLCAMKNAIHDWRAHKHKEQKDWEELHPTLGEE